MGGVYIFLGEFVIRDLDGQFPLIFERGQRRFRSDDAFTIDQKNSRLPYAKGASAPLFAFYERAVSMGFSFLFSSGVWRCSFSVENLAEYSSTYSG
jgi:hypothetical protein